VTALVLALLAATSAAFALTQALKLERSPITGPNFDRLFAPTCGCETATATLSLRLRSADTIDAALVDRDGDPVRTLARKLERDKGIVTFEWDGKDDAGAVVRDGRYRLRVHLERQERTIVIPVPIEVDTRPPAIELARVRPRVLSPDGDGRNDRATLVYRMDERSRIVVRVDGAVRARTIVLPPDRTRLRWNPRIDGRALPAGVHTIALEAHDLAGNVSTPTRALPVRIRYIEVVALRATRRVLRFSVSTDARPFRWSLVRLRARGGGRTIASGRSERLRVVVRFRPVLAPGRYRLRVAANGRLDDGRFAVRRARP